MTTPVEKQGENVGCAFISRPGGLMNAFCVAVQSVQKALLFIG